MGGFNCVFKVIICVWLVVAGRVLITTHGKCVSVPHASDNNVQHLGNLHSHRDCCSQNIWGCGYAVAGTLQMVHSELYQPPPPQKKTLPL